MEKVNMTNKSTFYLAYTIYIVVLVSSFYLGMIEISYPSDLMTTTHIPPMFHF